MRLIDADRLKVVMAETLDELNESPKMDGQKIHLLCAFHTVGMMVDHAKTFDAVTVVRCKGCRKYGAFSVSGKPTGKGWCDAFGKSVKGDWFCADGERKSDESEN